MKIVFEVSAGAVHNLGIASAISNQHVATNLCIPIEQILLITFPLSQQWFHANMCKRKKKRWKIFTLRAASEKTPPPKTVDQSQLSATMGRRRRNVWVGPVRASGFTVPPLNTCALSIHKYTFKESGLWGRHICLNIWKCLDVIWFTGQFFGGTQQ